MLVDATDRLGRQATRANWRSRSATRASSAAVTHQVPCGPVQAPWGFDSAMGTDGLSTHSQLRAERKRRTAKPREAQNRRARADKHNARAPTGACAVTERPRGHTHTHTHTKPQTTPTVGGLLGRCSSSRHAWSTVGYSRHLKSGRHRQAAVPMESLPLTRLHPCRRRSDANVSQWPAGGFDRRGAGQNDRQTKRNEGELGVVPSTTWVAPSTTPEATAEAPLTKLSRIVRARPWLTSNKSRLHPQN